MGRKQAYDRRSWGREAEAALAAPIAETCEQLGSAGREPPRVSANIAVIYTGNLVAVAEAFGEAAAGLGGRGAGAVGSRR